MFWIIVDPWEIAILKIGWFCYFKNLWEAQLRSTGFDSKVILEKVKNSFLRVKRDLPAESDLIIFPLFPNQKFNLNRCVMYANTFVRLLGLSRLPLSNVKTTSGWLVPSSMA
jgi:hypothetical protein